MWISSALAMSGSGEAGGGNPLISLLPLVAIFVIFYFLLIRPQQKKAKQHQAMVAALRRGDRVVTAGGIVCTVARVIDDGHLQCEIAEGVKVRILRSMITDVVPKTQPTQASKEG